ncbi:MAG: nucleotidyltransferase family protein [Pseudomonadota bacterium]|nr:nucleotidyltransferase family protein [Pseudomonadota bacterium]
MIKNIKNNLLNIESTVSDAVKILQKSKYKTVIIISSKNKVIGTITDGDIRRGLLVGISLDAPCKDVMNKRPNIAFQDDNKRINEILKTQTIVPIVNTNSEIIGMINSKVSPLKKNMKNLVVIMAGGEGKRLMPLTALTPKPMLPVKKKPLIHKIIEGIGEAGFKEIRISVHYKGEQLVNYFKNGKKFGVNIDYIHEEKPLGTAGCLSLIDIKNLDEPIIVLNGDVLTNIDYRRLINFHQKSKKSFTLCAAAYDISIPYGTIELKKDSIIDIEEKPIKKYLINAGIYVIEPSVIKEMKKNLKIDMTTLVKKYIKQKEVAVFPLHEFWIDIGNHEDYEKAQDL